MDSIPWRDVFPRPRWDQPVARFADHLSLRDRRHLLMGIGQYAAEGVLRLYPDAGDGNARSLFFSRFLSLLYLLGSDAGPDVLPHRYLGKRPAPLLGHQILSVYALRRRHHAAGNPGGLLLSWRSDRDLHIRYPRSDE